MSSVDYFFSCFISLDRNNPPEISDIKANDFSVDVTVLNVGLSTQGLKSLGGYFGDVPLSFRQLEGRHGIILSISRIKVPDDLYSVLSILKYIQAHQKDGLFMGIGEFGPSFLSFDELTHGQLYGASGFGKSSFFRFLLSQTLAFHKDVMNYIIDPKQIDYRAFQDHPQVGRIATNRDEWYSLMGALLIEMAAREYIYSEAFSTPPTSLGEYRQFKSELKRSDLPDLPRLLLWIDEAHMISEYHNEDLGNHLALLLKKGRAFGIHVMATTQRIADMPSTVKSQASTIMMFYMHDSMGLAGLSLEDYHKNTSAIRGRLSFYNSLQSRFFSCQAPFLTANEALGLSYGFGSAQAYPNAGFQRLKLAPSMLNEARLPAYLCRGYSLKALSKLTSTEAEEGLKPRGLYKFLYQDLYEIETTPDQSAPSPSTRSKPVADSDEQILRDFETLLNKGSLPSRSSTKTEIATPAAPLDPVRLPQALEIVTPSRSRNTPDSSILVQEFQKRYADSHVDFSWCERDLSGNQGLLDLYRCLKGSLDSQERPVVYADIAVDEITQSRLDKYIEEVKANSSVHRKSPLLILSGREGMGKRTIAEAVVQKTGFLARMSRPEDLVAFDSVKDEVASLLSEDRKPSPPKTETAEAPSEFIFFSDLNAVVLFYRNCNPRQIPVLLNTWQDGIAGIYNKVAKDFMELKEPHVSVELTAETYKSDAVLEKLIKTLLKKYDFARSLKDVTLKPFVASGIPLVPLYLDALIERVHKRAFLGSKPFDWELLKEHLETYKIKETEKATGVTVVIPGKTLDDIVAREETVSDLRDVIHKSKTLDDQRAVFAQRLRRGGRMVALFSGPPGTGKSMAAEIVAKEAGKELWICDFGKMQSAYVGETEKILSDIFFRAQSSKVVLLLDEADAFLANRSGNQASFMVKWINHLLTLIENFNGILILTTNFPENLDPAFSRRIDVKARFFEPDQTQLKALIRKMLEPDAPLAVDLDLDKALDGIRLSGGLARNALERLVLKMERFHAPEITTDLLRSALLETQEENLHLVETEKRIGLA